MKKIEDIGNEYARALADLTPKGYSPKVALLDDSGRKKRKDAAAHNWDPLAGSISITFVRPEEPEEASNVPARPLSPRPESVQPEVANALPEPLVEAIRALDSAEQRVSFVALKWFRDQELPKLGGRWSAVPGANQEIVKQAIEQGIFLTNKVHNPKSPAFPTTAIRLNRQSTEVQKLLGSSLAAHSRVFRPVGIKGAGLSDTIIQERG